MSTRSAILKASSVLSGGKSIAFVCSFLRNAILARELSKADFGVAATFALMVSMLEFSDKWALDRQVIQSRHTDDPVYMGTAHLSQFLLGMLSTALMVLAATPLSRLFSIPEVASAFRWLALIPACRALHHLDVSRMVRELRFGPSVTVEIIPHVLITLAAWPMARWLGDYRALLCLLLARWALTTAGTHLLAQRPYRWTWNAHYARQIGGFGWPLLVNGMLMFAITQGDRMVVGISATMDDLGTYAVAAQITLVPGMMFVSILSSLLLPLMSRAQDIPDVFRVRYRLCAQVMAVFAILFAGFVSTAGDVLVPLIFGAKYSGCGPLVACLVCAQAVRLMKVAPAMGSMAKGDTRNMMISNAVRLVGLGLAILFVLRGGGLLSVAVAGLVSETLSYAVSAVRFSARHAVRLSDSAIPALWAIGAIAIAIAVHVAAGPTTNSLLDVMRAGCVAVALTLVALRGMPEGRREMLLAMALIRTSAMRRWGASR